MLEPQRQHRLLHLALERPLRRQVRHAHELLGDGAAALARAPGREVVQGRAHDAADIDAAVLVKAPVLDGDDGAGEVRRHVARRQLFALEHAAGCERLTVVRLDDQRARRHFDDESSRERQCGKAIDDITASKHGHGCQHSKHGLDAWGSADRELRAAPKPLDCARHQRARIKLAQCLHAAGANFGQFPGRGQCLSQAKKARQSPSPGARQMGPQGRVECDQPQPSGGNGLASRRERCLPRRDRAARAAGGSRSGRRLRGVCEGVRTHRRPWARGARRCCSRAYAPQLNPTRRWDFCSESPGTQGPLPSAGLNARGVETKHKPRRDRRLSASKRSLIFDGDLVHAVVRVAINELKER
jgi:hypothetical protein